jgi:hypothetical protein
LEYHPLIKPTKLYCEKIVKFDNKKVEWSSKIKPIVSIATPQMRTVNLYKK